MGRFQLESIYLYFPPSSQLLYIYIYYIYYIYIYIYIFINILIINYGKLRKKRVEHDFTYLPQHTILVLIDIHRIKKKICHKQINFQWCLNRVYLIPKLNSEEVSGKDHRYIKKRDILTSQKTLHNWMVGLGMLLI